MEKIDITSLEVNGWKRHNHNNSQVTTTVYQIMSYEVKSWAFVINKFINMTFITSNVASSQNTSPPFIILLSPVEKNLIWIRKEICTVYKQKQQKCLKQLSTVHNCLKLKHLNNVFLTNTQLLFLGLLMWCFYQLFGLSFWRQPFT